MVGGRRLGRKGVANGGLNLAGEGWEAEGADYYAVGAIWVLKSSERDEGDEGESE
jgi:hypothetical protein